MDWTPPELFFRAILYLRFLPPPRKPRAVRQKYIKKEADESLSATNFRLEKLCWFRPLPKYTIFRIDYLLLRLALLLSIFYGLHICLSRPRVCNPRVFSSKLCKKQSDGPLLSAIISKKRAPANGGGPARRYPFRQADRTMGIRGTSSCSSRASSAADRLSVYRDRAGLRPRIR